MTGPEMREWRKRLGFTRAAAASALGLSASRIVDYESGTKRGTSTPALIPKHVALACVTVEMLKLSDWNVLRLVVALLDDASQHTDVL